LKLQQAPERWTPEFQNKLNSVLENEDRKNLKNGSNIELVQNKLILRSPNGSRFALSVSNAGVLSATAL